MYVQLSLITAGLTHWPLGDFKEILDVIFKLILDGWSISWSEFVTLLIGQHWFRLWHQAITWANIYLLVPKLTKIPKKA